MLKVEKTASVIMTDKPNYYIIPFFSFFEWTRKSSSFPHQVSRTIQRAVLSAGKKKDL